MVVPDVADLSNPVVVQLVHALDRDQGGVVTKTLGEESVE